jgi:hypothetical protein
MTWRGKVILADLAPNHPFAGTCIHLGMKRPTTEVQTQAATDKKVETVTEQAATPEPPPPKIKP